MSTAPSHSDHPHPAHPVPIFATDSQSEFEVARLPSDPSVNPLKQAEPRLSLDLGELLVDWHSGSCSGDQEAALAAILLFFPDPPPTRDVRDSIAHGSTPVAVDSLIPGHTAAHRHAKTLLLREIEDPRSLEAGEYGYLLAHLLHPTSAEDADKCFRVICEAQQIGAFASNSLSLQGSTLSKLCDALPASHCQAIGHGLYLSRVLGIPFSTLDDLVTSGTITLGAVQYEERFLKAPSQSLGESPLLLRKRDAIQSLVKVENFLHAEGLLTTLSSEERIGKLLAIPPELAICIGATLSSEAREYRNTHLRNSRDPLTDLQRRQIVASVAREVERARTGEGRIVRTNQQIAVLEGVDELTVFCWLASGLSASDWSYRQQRIPTPLPSDAPDPISFRIKELAALREGTLPGIIPHQKLARLFGLSEDNLRQKEQLLSQEDRDLLLWVAPDNDAHTIVHRDPVDLMLHRVALRFASSEAGKTHSTRKTEKGKVVLHGIPFDSCEEATCAVMLNRYIPGYRLESGTSVHVLNNGRVHDFVIDTFLDGRPFRAVFEYHVPRLFYSRARGGDFQSREEYQAYQECRAGLAKEHRAEFDEQVRASVLRRYHHDRSELMSNHPNLQGYTLVTLGSPEQLYYELLRIGCQLPSKARFLVDFERSLREFRGMIRG